MRKNTLNTIDDYPQSASAPLWKHDEKIQKYIWLETPNFQRPKNLGGSPCELLNLFVDLSGQQHFNAPNTNSFVQTDRLVSIKMLPGHAVTKILNDFLSSQAWIFSVCKR